MRVLLAPPQPESLRAFSRALWHHTAAATPAAAAAATAATAAAAVFPLHADSLEDWLGAALEAGGRSPLQPYVTPLAERLRADSAAILGAFACPESGESVAALERAGVRGLEAGAAAPLWHMNEDAWLHVISLLAVS
jgi:hypothetical protein